MCICVSCVWMWVYIARDICEFYVVVYVYEISIKIILYKQELPPLLLSLIQKRLWSSSSSIVHQRAGGHERRCFVFRLSVSESYSVSTVSLGWRYKTVRGPFLGACYQQHSFFASSVLRRMLFLPSSIRTNIVHAVQDHEKPNVFSLLCQCGLHVVPWSLSSILIHLLAAEPHSSQDFYTLPWISTERSHWHSDTAFDGVGLAGLKTHWNHDLKNTTMLTRFFNPTKKKSVRWRHCQSEDGGPSVLCPTISRNTFVSRCI